MKGIFHIFTEDFINTLTKLSKEFLTRSKMHSRR